MESFLKSTKDATKIARTLSGKLKTTILYQMSEILLKEMGVILEANKKDLEYAKANSLSEALIDRLLLDQKRINSMAVAIKEIAELKEPVGRILDGWVMPNGLKIQKVSIPIGVVAIIYESRPNVTSDAAALCFKSGNVALLKGGKEADNSNRAIANLLQDVLVKNSLPKNLISIFPDTSREGVAKLIKMNKYIDLVIPRGGEGLIRFIEENSTIPVIKHDKGVCHLYIHKSADLKKAIPIAINAKTQRTGVCNAIETLLVDEEIAKVALLLLKEAFSVKNTELRGCTKTREIIEVKEATEDDWYAEYLANILAIRVVKDLDEAIEHINKYGSGHSDSIITEDYTASERFLNEVDSACVYVNASTRFTDGGEFGFGAEVGISTNKLHSRGPMGINDLTTYKYQIYGSGQIRE